MHGRGNGLAIFAKPIRENFLGPPRVELRFLPTYVSDTYVNTMRIKIHVRIRVNAAIGISLPSWYDHCSACGSWPPAWIRGRFPKYRLSRGNRPRLIQVDPFRNLSATRFRNGRTRSHAPLGTGPADDRHVPLPWPATTLTSD